MKKIKRLIKKLKKKRWVEIYSILVYGFEFVEQIY